MTQPMHRNDDLVVLLHLPPVPRASEEEAPGTSGGPVLAIVGGLVSTVGLVLWLAGRDASTTALGIALFCLGHALAVAGLALRRRRRAER